MDDLLAHTLGGLVHLEWHTDGAWCVFADQPQLELALMNLIINARDAMPDGGTIIIAAENRRPSNRTRPSESRPAIMSCFRSPTTGCGISASDLDKVIEPFFTTKEVGKGTGLGLSMVYGFAKQSEGAFRVQSELGRGTRAEIWLPRAETPADQRPGRTAKAKAKKSQRALTILLVDDHDEVRTATAAMLEELGHTVIQAANGIEAAAALSDGAARCDLLISDYAMPKMSGIELIRQARLLRPGLPSLIVTGYAQGDAVVGGEVSVDVLFKPFTLEDLATAINGAVQQAGRIASLNGALT